VKYLPVPDVLVAHLSGEAVLLDLRDKNYYRLNETAARVWRALENGRDKAGIVDDVTSEFSVTPEDASSEIDRLLTEFIERRLIVESAVEGE